jgi:hypothetical protein
MKLSEERGKTAEFIDPCQREYPGREFRSTLRHLWHKVQGHQQYIRNGVQMH